MAESQKKAEEKTVFTTKDGVPLTESYIRDRRFIVFTNEEGGKTIGKIVSIDPDSKKAIVKVNLGGGALKDLLRGFKKTEKIEIDADKIIGVGITGKEALGWKPAIEVGEEPKPEEEKPEEEKPAQAEKTKLEKDTDAAFERMKKGAEGAKSSGELKGKLANWEKLAEKSPGTDIALAYGRFKKEGCLDKANAKVKELEGEEKEELQKKKEKKKAPPQEWKEPVKSKPKQVQEKPPKVEWEEPGKKAGNLQGGSSLIARAAASSEFDDGVKNMGAKKYRQAIKNFKTALESNPNLSAKEKAIVNRDIGIALLYMKNYGEARKSFETAIKLDPKLADAYLGVGNCIERTSKIYEVGKRLEAKKYFDRYYELSGKKR